MNPAAVSARRAAAGAVITEIMQLPMAQRRGPLFAACFARAAAPVMQRDLAPIVERVRPDVILRETGELAAAPEPARAEVIEDLRPLWEAAGAAT